MATGVGAARAIVASSPELARCEDLAGVKDVPSTDVIAVRLFLDKPVSLPNQSNVFAGFALGGDEDAKDVAGTFFDLCQLKHVIHHFVFKNRSPELLLHLLIFLHKFQELYSKLEFLLLKHN